MRQVAITTVDNPHDPFEEFIKWDNWDRQNGYNTNSLLAKLARTSSELTDEINLEIIEGAIEEIVKMFNGELYKKLVKNEPSLAESG